MTIRSCQWSVDSCSCVETREFPITIWLLEERIMFAKYHPTIHSPPDIDVMDGI